MYIIDIDNQKILGQTKDIRAISMLTEIFGDDCINANGDLCIEESEIFIFADYARIFKERFNKLKLNV